MSYVIMNVGTEQLYRKPRHYGAASYPTRHGARIACSKLNKSFGPGQWVVMSLCDFTEQFDPYVDVKSLMTGATVKIRRSEKGGCCDPSQERYWTM